MRAARPGAWEYELEGAAEGTFRSLGAERVGYPSIVGTGINATTLHYDKSRSQLQAGELVVMDMGAEYGFYSADVTRTIPASGKFSPRQLSIYNLVLATLRLEIPVGGTTPLTISLELSRVNEPVTIEAPPAGEVKDAPG